MQDTGGAAMQDADRTQTLKPVAIAKEYGNEQLG